MRTESWVLSVLRSGFKTKLEILHEIDRRAKIGNNQRPNRFEVWSTIEYLLKCEAIKKLPTNHSEADWESNYSLTESD